MPVGRLYQAPTVTVPRNTPVYGIHGLKATSNSDLFMVRGKSLSSKSKSPSPDKLLDNSSYSNGMSNGQRRGQGSPTVNRARKSPSPRLSELSLNGSCETGTSSATRPPPRTTRGKGRSRSRDPSSLRSASNSHMTSGRHHQDLEQQHTASREKSWSPESSDIINNNINNSTSSYQGERQVDNSRISPDRSDRLPQINQHKSTTTSTSTSSSSVSPKLQQNSRLQNGYGKDEHDTSSSATSDSTGGLGGLKNLGNTCFMNSVIQCLSNTRELVDYLVGDHHTHDLNTTNSSMKGSLVKAFATVIKNLWKPNARVVDPSSLKGAIQRFAPRFSGYNQEDSQELLRYLLEGLHEDVNRVTVKPQPIHSEIDSNLSVHEQAMEAWKRYLRRDDSKLVDIFVGQLKSTLRCSTCQYESVTFEPFWDLSLPIPSRSGEISLTDCLEAFTKEEVLDGDEMPTCARCKTRRRCIKYYSLYKLPRVLVIHLKRFSPTERFRSKLSTTVNFPLTGFDVAKYSDTKGRSTYSCYAVSNHSGTLYSGHYTAFAKNPRTSEWHYFNDSRVSKSSSSNVISNEAYLLFFELL